MDIQGKHAVGPEGNGRIEELVAEATALKEVVGDLTTALTRQRFFSFATAAALFLDVILTVVLATVLNGQASTNRQIKESLRQNYATSQQQAQTRVKVLCPLYTVLLTSAADPARRAGLSVAGQKQFDASVQTIKDGYATLGCQPPLP